MPLYELLCLARPRLPREDMSRMISRVGSAVFDKGGVITELKSFAEQPLAYPIRKTHGKYEEVRGVLGNGARICAESRPHKLFRRPAGRAAARCQGKPPDSPGEASPRRVAAAQATPCCIFCFSYGSARERC